MYCTFHRTKTHNTDACRAAAAAGTTTKPRNSTNPCRRCGAPNYNSQHRCGTAVRTPNQTNQTSNMSFSAMTIRHDNKEASNSYSSSSVPASASSSSCFTPSSVPASAIQVSRVELQAVYDAGIVDATNNINDFHLEDYNEDEKMLDAQAQECKYHNEFSLLPENKSNMIIFPIIIENIKTYAILDTGATFSMISPAFASFLGDSVEILPATGTIQLGHSDTRVERP